MSFAMCSQPLGKSLGVDSWVCGLGETGRSGGGSGWAELPFRSALGPATRQLEMAPRDEKRCK